MKKQSKTAFDRYFETRIEDAGFASAYTDARVDIDATDQLVRALDAARIERGLSKAELARRIGAKPEIVRRLFAASSANPTLTTVITVANALGLHLELVPSRASSGRKRAAGKQAGPPRSCRRSRPPVSP